VTDRRPGRVKARERQREYQRRWYLANRRRLLDRARGRYLANPERRHEYDRHRKTKSPLLRLWYGVLYRCHNSRCHVYKYYGGRGISVYDQWRHGKAGYESFAAYIIEHLGTKPSQKHSLDQIDNDRGYEPGNLRWATHAEQRNNRRDSIGKIST
jgi:hypothetical protein